MAQALTLGASLLILGYLFVDEMLFRARPTLRRHGLSRLPRFGRLPWQAYIPIPVAVFFAWRFWTMPPIISVYVLAVGGLTTLYLANKAGLSERVLLDRQITDLVRAFQSIYQLKPSVFSALEDAAKKVDDPLRFHVMRAVQTFFVTGQPKRSFDELHERVDNPYLDQFLYILDRAETSRREEILKNAEPSHPAVGSPGRATLGDGGKSGRNQWSDALHPGAQPADHRVYLADTLAGRVHQLDGRPGNIRGTGYHRRTDLVGNRPQSR